MLLAWAVLAGAAAGAEDFAPPPTLALIWHDPVGALPFSDHRLAADLRAVLQPAGVELAWTAGVSGATSGSELHVVLLATAPPGCGQAMGSVKRGASSRTAWVNLDTVERTIGLRPHANALLGPLEIQALSRALARVIAHELVHLAAPELPHTQGGLMAPSLARPFLTAPRVWLPAPAAAALRAAAAGEYAASQVALSER